MTYIPPCWRLVVAYIRIQRNIAFIDGKFIGFNSGCDGSRFSSSGFRQCKTVLIPGYNEKVHFSAFPQSNRPTNRSDFQSSKTWQFFLKEIAINALKSYEIRGNSS